MRDSEFEFIRSLVYERSRISLGRDKRDLVAARLGKRLRANKIASIGEYCRMLQENCFGKSELSFLIDVISTHHTFFFREGAHFEFLRNTALPELAARAKKEHWPRLRAWSAACSSGEEPYTLAIVMAECLQSHGLSWHIDATDVSEGILEKARNGIYKADALEQVSPDRRKTFFQCGIGPQSGNFRVKTNLRSNVTFQQLNLLSRPLPFSEPFPIIFCRNVMIYFDRPTHEELLQNLTGSLIPGGYLLVGHSESLTGIKHNLEMVAPATYRRPLDS
jgi:chemotaxis protein methyltransferase CheR